ncbi:MAG: hydrogenase expression protein HypE [Chloroflexi bacterium]|nr:hydrogenase expression protein HypE [Chloroflexota bacterium]
MTAAPPAEAPPRQEELGSNVPPESPEPAPVPVRPLRGPVKVVHAFWLAGMSCDGCSIAATGATNPSVEDLLTGGVSGLPTVVLHHPVLSVENGEEFIKPFQMASDGELDAPYVVIYEGSIADESLAAQTGGYWSAMGDQAIEDGERPFPTAERLAAMAPNAAAVIAIGTCATWGGIPSSIGNPTGAMSIMDFLGADYRSALGLPVINIPGCAPVGDNFTETVATILMFLQGMGPLPEFDELGRPAWLFGETVHRGCTRAGYYEEGIFAENYGDKECLVEVGCWGPVVNCNIVSRGAQSHMGGCMAAGGVCIGCTMPGFPDKFSPFYKAPPGSSISSTASKSVGFGIRRLRSLSNRALSREPRWDRVYDGEVPSGWGKIQKPDVVDDVVHFFYEKIQFNGSRRPGRSDGRNWATDVPEHVPRPEAPASRAEGPK